MPTREKKDCQVVPQTEAEEVRSSIQVSVLDRATRETQTIQLLEGEYSEFFTETGEALRLRFQVFTGINGKKQTEMIAKCGKAQKLCNAKEFDFLHFTVRILE
jgi:hypothetical protein